MERLAAGRWVAGGGGADNVEDTTLSFREEKKSRTPPLLAAWRHVRARRRAERGGLRAAVPEKQLA
jgi:hypothetical protein